MNWNFDMTDAPYDGLTKCLIAVKHPKKLRWCVWNRIGDSWSGLLPGEEPLCFFVPEHPTKNVAPSLPPGVAVPVAPTPVIPTAPRLPPGVN